MQTTLAELWSPSEPDVMDISGRLDDGTAPHVEEDALLCIGSGTRRMVLNCGELNYITGAGMRALLTLARAMEATDGRLAICGLQPQIEEMFAITGFGAIIPVYGDSIEAGAALAA